MALSLTDAVRPTDGTAETYLCEVWSIVAALSAYNRGIGWKGKLPWHIPLELRLFRQLTWGGVLVMGRKTWESIQKPLPGREIWVLSRQGSFCMEGIRFFPTQSALLEALAGETRPAFFAGGGHLYEWALSLPQVSFLYLSWIYTKGPADIFFPSFSEEEWEPFQVDFFDLCSRHPSFVRAAYRKVG